MRPLRLSDVVQAILILAGFVVAAGWYVFADPELSVSLWSDFTDLLPASVIAAAVFWLGTNIRQEKAVLSTATFEQACIGSGMVLIGLSLAPSLVTIVIPPAPVWGGCFVASCFLFMARRWLDPRLNRSRPSLMLVGFGPAEQKLLDALPHFEVAGAIVQPDRAATLPANVPWLGPPGQLMSAVLQHKPSHLVVADWEPDFPRRMLLDCRRAGINVSDIRPFHERHLARVCAAHSEPGDFLLPDVNLKRNAAFQAIYSNVIGLVLLIACFPLLLLLALLVRLNLGPGPVLERTDCMGFLRVPFSLLAFRTSRLGERWRPSPLGSWLRSSGLYRLPHLINVIRGELSICGPRPTRIDIAQQLQRMIPFYEQRFLVKPGFFGWARCQMARRNLGQQPLELEYDLFYLKELSPSLDFVILLRSLLSLGEWR
jgi:lipopolysaccharide/colanic/teichoic acid biosynthesis glycosyltransferase